MNMISTLEFDISREREILKLISCENLEMRDQIEDIVSEKSSIEEELTETLKTTKSLEMEIQEMGSALGQMNDTIESPRSSVNELTGERDYLHMEVLNLNEKLEMEQVRAEESEATAMEIQHLAESRKIYAEEKGVEVKLLERSVVAQ